jgi:hypothetical protein
MSYCRKYRGKYSELTEEEATNFSIKVLNIVYQSRYANPNILKTESFNFTVSKVHTDHPFAMCLRYRICYVFVMRCKSLQFCFSDDLFSKIQKFFQWRLNVLSGYCFVKFNTTERMLPANCKSNFEILNKFCSDYYFRKCAKDRLVNMSRYFYFMLKVISEVLETRNIISATREE